MILIIVAIFLAGSYLKEAEVEVPEEPEPEVEAETHAVSMKFFAFDPAEVTIKVGDTVTWTNDEPSKVDHHMMSGTVDAEDMGELFDEEIEFEESFSYTFDEAGEFDYHCHIHTSMTGKVIVEE